MKPMTPSLKLSGRGLSIRLKTARGRKLSSQKWLIRQLNDPYVQQARMKGYRSRAAFKLLEIHQKYTLFKPGQTVVDLGAAPGGWSQVAAKHIHSSQAAGSLLAIDLVAMEPLTGVTFVRGDFLDPEVQAALRNQIPEGVDVVMSDMAASTTGHATTDHLRTIALAEAAYTFARSCLKPGGSFIAKVFQGGTDATLLAELKKSFKTVKHVKPQASRKESPEMYVVAQGFRA
jgi:23S rRNA (uridine2552-2'-O)-methyltransferase